MHHPVLLVSYLAAMSFTSVVSFTNPLPTIESSSTHRLSSVDSDNGGANSYVSSMRRLAVTLGVSVGLFNTFINPAHASMPSSSFISTSSILTSDAADDYAKERKMVLETAIQPSDSDNQMVQMAFRDYDQRRFDASDKEFSMSLDKWKSLKRPRDEIVSLLKARANVRLDNKQFDSAIKDYNDAIDMMKVDGETEDGKGRYPEYIDTFVGRALAKEGLKDWKGALADYDKAAVLWGGIEASSAQSGKESASQSDEFLVKRFEGVNPYVLTFRGNTLAKLNEIDKALVDYRVASDVFLALKDVARYSDARANYALALYQQGAEDTGSTAGSYSGASAKEIEALKVMKDIIRKNPGYADMHVAVAADDWYRGNYIDALKEWRFACDRIDVGCEAYKDSNWVSTVRRWPASLSSRLTIFINREIPESIKGAPGSTLAPISTKN